MLSTTILLSAVSFLLAGHTASADPGGGATAPPPRTSKVVLHCLSVDSTGAATDPASAAVLDEAIRVLGRTPTATVMLAAPVNCSADDTALSAHPGDPRAVQHYLHRRGFAQARVEGRHHEVLTPEGTEPADAMGESGKCQGAEELCLNR